MRFSIRDILLGTTIVGLLLGWMTDHQALVSNMVKIKIVSRRYEDRQEAIEALVDFGSGPDAIACLIYAVSDPDERVATAADSRLRAISGNSEGYGPVSRSSICKRLTIVRQWIDWYLRQRDVD